MKKLSMLVTTLFLSPVVTFAAQADIRYFSDLGTKALLFIQKTLMPLVFALALLAFVWGVFNTFILGGSNSEKQKEGKQLMMYSVLGFVAMFAIWGIVAFVISVIGITPREAIDIPNFPTY